MALRYYVSTEEASFFVNNKMGSSDRIPTSGTYKVGDFIISNTQANGVFGWVCTQAGTPGTWIEIGTGGSNTKTLSLSSSTVVSSPVSQVAIGIKDFNKSTDFLMVYKNSTYLTEGVDYDISSDSTKIVSRTGNWNADSLGDYRFSFVVIKEVEKVSPEAVVGTENLKDSVVTMTKLGEDVIERLDEVDSKLNQNVKKTSSFVNVMQYKNLVVKAKDNDGNEYDDWFNAIQTAINENNRVEIPNGVFGISSPIKIRDYKIVKGNGRSTQLVAKQEMICVLDIDNYVTSTSYTEIENIFIHGNNLAIDGIRCVGFTNNSSIKNMWIEYCTKNGIYLTKAWYSRLERMQIRFCYNGITVISSSDNPERQTGNVNCMNFSDMYIAFINNIGINFESDSGYSNMISNSTIEACDNHGIYIKNIISPVTCQNVYMETIKNNGYQVDSGNCLNIIGGYICVDSNTSRCVQVGKISKLIIKGTSMTYWGGDLEYMVYSLATVNEISMVPLSTVSKRTIYYTGEFIGSIENVIGSNGSDFGHNMSSLTTKKINLTETVGYGVNTGIEFIKGSTVKGSVDASRIYQYIERTTLEGGWGASKITLYGKVNDSSDTEKKVYDINNGFFKPYRLHLAGFNTTTRPSEKVEGMVIYDLNLKKPIVWNGNNWTDFAGTVV